MFEHLKKLITTHDLSALFSFCSNLADNERLALLEEFQQSKWGLKESFWDKGMFELQTPNDSDYEFIMALFLLTRSVEEYQALSIHEICGYYVASSRFFSNPKALHILPKILQEEKYRFILDLFHSVKPEDREFIAFETYWVLYKAGEIPFDEALFTKNITATYLYDDKKVRYTDLVLHDQEFHDKIFRRLHYYENQMFHDAKPWEDFFVHLQRQGYVFDRKYIPELLESLLNPWKKPHLNWHCRWIEFLEPTTDELLACQQTLFALLSTGNTNLINFALKHIQQIASEKAFDFQAFTDNFALCFTTQKIAKSQLIGLHILEKHYQKQAPTNPDYREQLAVLFTVPDAKLQEKAASLLKTYFGGEGLVEVVVPYQDYLKGKAQELLATLSPTPIQNDNLSSQLTDCSPSEKSVRVGYVTELETPTTPEALLFLLGDCLRERTPQTIDLFFEGFNQLQDDFPADFKEQLAPYLKQLERHWNGIASVPILRWFLQRWTGDKKKLNKEDETFFLTTLPYLYHKAQHLLEKLKEKNKLPFLSTPTHAPFYIEAEALMDRLLQYEAQGENPDLHDLVVACNRLLFKEVSATAKEKAQQLKGAYTPAIQYYIGLTDKVQPTEELLPLWTQITRIKHPDSEFVEFANTSAKDFPTVVKPFMIDFWMKTRKQSDVTFHYLNLEDNWNNNFDMKQKPTKYPFPYYNTGNSRKGWETDKLYQCSLNPHYPEAQILRYIASYAKGNESYDIEYMQTSMQVLLENHLPIYHSGWLFVAAALLSEKKPTRDMAAAYILEHLEYGTNLNLLAQYIGKLLAEQYAPIARFVEFLDIPTRDPKIKAFQKAVVEAYLPLAEKLEKKPTNHKKLATFIN
ncbi:DUF6493 family protein [Capnocytophaga gingivalis]|uniref:DUF6493 family protein n=1 Tax=Capnocytophaga gingivalis TaxID=1017 RepID=UPI0028E645FE|nr:DUF6493 family protein [Capnocytophaga gingivalis]